MHTELNISEGVVEKIFSLKYSKKCVEFQGCSPRNKKTTRDRQSKNATLISPKEMHCWTKLSLISLLPL